MNRATLLLLVLAATLPTAAAQGAPREENLLRNPGFDADLASWQPLSTVDGAQPGPGGAAVWSSRDVEGARRSGSVEIRTSAVHERYSFALGQCVEVKRPMDDAAFGGRIRVPPDQAAAGSAYLSLETFALPGCAGTGSRQSRIEPIANADYWSQRIDRAMIRGAASVRLRAIVTKPYEWADGDETGMRDDHVAFRAFFDDLFLRFYPDDTDLPGPPRKPTAGFSATADVGKVSARWGKFTVDPPRLLLELPPSKRGTSEDPIAVYSSNDAIYFRVLLKHPYRYDDPHRYPIEGLSVDAENVSRGLAGRPTLELVVYRVGDPERTPLAIFLTSTGGGGVYDGGSDNSVGLRLAGPSEYRTRALRTIWECLSAAAQSRAKAKGDSPAATPTATDEQIEASPLAAMVPLTPPGDYELVARYQALAAGFWHEPIFSDPVRIRIVEKDLGCGSPKTTAH